MSWNNRSILFAAYNAISSKNSQPIQWAKILLAKLKNSPRLKKIGLPLLAAWVAYILTLIPVSENLERCKNCSPIRTSDKQKLLIYNISSTNGILLEYVADPKQIVSIHFDKAKLDDSTINLLGSFIPDIPKTPQAIDFRPIKNEASKIFVKIMLRSPATTPNALYIFRELTPNKLQPDFKIKADGLELAIEIAQISSDENSATDDKSYLTIGNWHTKLAGIQLRVNPAKNTDIAFRFDIDGWNTEKPFEAFYIPDSNHHSLGEIPAQGLATIATQDENQLIDNLLCAAPKNEAVLWRGSKKFRNGTCPESDVVLPLKLTAFKIGKEGIQLFASGHAWAKINGELTNNVITFAKKYIENNPVLKLLFDKAKKVIEL